MLIGNWNICNKLRLEKLISEKAFSNNYAVFDWDFTCIFFDVQESLFLYQVENLCFKMPPEQFAVMIRSGIPQDIPLIGCVNHDGIPLTAGVLSCDLDDRYRFLYARYTGLGGRYSLEAVRKTAEYMDFKAKILLLMAFAPTVCPTDLSQSLCTGMSLSELETAVETAIDESLQEPIRSYTIESPQGIRSSAGSISVYYQKGVRLQPEIQDLFRCLQANGITVYVCSASQEDGVRVFACTPKYGYCLKPENVFGRRRKRNSAGIFTGEFDNSIPQTWKEGKAEAIKTLIAPNHNGNPPVLIAGDSDGDFYMMEAFKEEALVLVFDRSPPDQAKITQFIKKGHAEQGLPDASVIVQRRDESSGRMIAEVE